jgi:molecular chaperone DnaK
MDEHQPAVDIRVFQGENRDVRLNHRIGDFKIEGLGKFPAGNEIVVQFDLNLDGMLKVTAREKATGLNKQVTIENALSEFVRDERDDARARLNELWRAGADEADPFADNPATIPITAAAPAGAGGDGHGEVVQARALLEKADRLLPDVAAADRGDIEQLCGKLREALDDRAWERVAAATNELSDVLFYVEDA